MPNWRECDLTVEVPCEKDKGAKQNGLKQIVALKKICECFEKPLNENRFIPYPKNSELLIEFLREC